MTLREKVIKAKTAYLEGRKSDLADILREIEEYFQSIGEPDRDNPPIALCCFCIERGKVYCGDENIIFSGTPEERKKYCIVCYNLCRREYENLKKIAGGKNE